MKRIDRSKWLNLVQGRSRVLSAGLIAVMVFGTAAFGAENTEWSASDFEREKVIRIRTQAPDDDEHWFPIWVVELEGDVYIRLGTRAAKHFLDNVDHPVVGVRVGEKQFDRISGEEVPDLVDEVAAAMSDKYFTDFLVRWVPHPLTLRLLPATPVSED